HRLPAVRPDEQFPVGRQRGPPERPVRDQLPPLAMGRPREPDPLPVERQSADTIGKERDVLDRVLMPADALDQRPVGGLPDPNRTVLAPGGQVLAVRTEAN